jgi:hypothetical protein
MAVGSKCTLCTAVWPGFNVIGNVAPDTVNPIPVIALAPIERGSVPVDVNVAGWAVAVFNATFSKVQLPALRLGVDRVRSTLIELPPVAVFSTVV